MISEPDGLAVRLVLIVVLGIYLGGEDLGEGMRIMAGMACTRRDEMQLKCTYSISKVVTSADPCHEPRAVQAV